MLAQKEMVLKNILQKAMILLMILGMTMILIVSAPSHRILIQIKIMGKKGNLNKLD
jgi:hypothetical protein